jgi:hypothetical protein
MFPPEDDAVLEYVRDEGKKCEPYNYVPVVPAALLDNMSLPGNGWKYVAYARDWNAVYSVTQGLLNELAAVRSMDEMKMPGTGSAADAALPFWSRGWTGELRDTPSVRIVHMDDEDAAMATGERLVAASDLHGTRAYAMGKLWFVGIYHRPSLSSDVVYVTELPFGVWVNTWKARLLANDSEGEPVKPLIAGVVDKSKGDAIRLEVTFIKGGINMLYEEPHKNVHFDPLELYLELGERVEQFLNYTETIGGHTRVRECGAYMEALHVWFAARYDTYVARVNRRVIVLGLLIKRHEEICRFIPVCDKYAFHSLTEEKGDAALASDGFAVFNGSALDAPDDIPTAELVARIMGGPTATPKKPLWYGYLLGKMTPRERMTKRTEARRAELAAWREELATLEADIHGVVCGTWRKELAALNELTQKAMKDPRFWLCNEKPAKYS